MPVQTGNDTLSTWGMSPAGKDRHKGKRYQSQAAQQHPWPPLRHEAGLECSEVF